MKKKGIQVFISYRRATGRETARNIYERLSLNGINTFFDYNSMRNGKFNSQIYDAIEQADDFILILSKDALLRCEDPDDWVRIEIEHALKHDKNIILLSTESEIVFPDNLPVSLQELPNYHAMTLNQEYYDESVRKLMGMLSFKPKATGSLVKLMKGGIASKVGKILLPIGILIIGIIAFIWGLINKDIKDDAINKTQGVIAKLYLPRYADIDREVLDIPWFSTHNKDFEYIDTIIGDNYHILPHSAYFTDNTNEYFKIITDSNIYYHNLPLRLSIHNTKLKTQVFNSGELEILEIHPVSNLFVSIHDGGHSLHLFSHTNFSPNEYILRYSLLHCGESFFNYKNTEHISSPEYLISLCSADSIIGEIKSGTKSWKYRHGFKNMSSQDDDNGKYNDISVSKILPASSNVNVFQIEINSMETPSYYPLHGFSRQIVKGEVDDDLYIIINSEFSFDAKLRIKLTTVDDKTVYSEPIYVSYIKPRYYENNPF